MTSIAVGAVVKESGENVGLAASSGDNLIKLERTWRFKWYNRGVGDTGSKLVKGWGGLGSLAGAICGTEGVCMRHDVEACHQRRCYLCTNCAWRELQKWKPHRRNYLRIYFYLQ